MSILDDKELEEMPRPPYGTNPFEKDGSWFWYDETGDLSTAHTSRESAQAELDRYIRYLTGEES